MMCNHERNVCLSVQTVWCGIHRNQWKIGKDKMMDAVKFLRERERMCDGMDGCSSCKLYAKNSGYDLTCDGYVKKCPNEAVKIVEKWSEEHPQKTLKDEFLEKYPNAPINKEYGFPLSICPSELGYKNKCTNAEKYISGCAACWNRPLSEVK